MLSQPFLTRILIYFSTSWCITHTSAYTTSLACKHTHNNYINIPELIYPNGQCFVLLRIQVCTCCTLIRIDCTPIQTKWYYITFNQFWTFPPNMPRESTYVWCWLLLVVAAKPWSMPTRNSMQIMRLSWQQWSRMVWPWSMWQATFGRTAQLYLRHCGKTDCHSSMQVKMYGLVEKWCSMQCSRTVMPTFTHLKMCNTCWQWKNIAPCMGTLAWLFLEASCGFASAFPLPCGGLQSHSIPVKWHWGNSTQCKANVTRRTINVIRHKSNVTFTKFSFSVT